MGTLASIITALSDDVVAALAAASYPPLTPTADGDAGEILVGSAALFEQSSPPRIIFEPIGFKWSDADYSSANASLSAPERRVQNVRRTVAAEDVLFAVRCWGAAGTNRPVDDYDVTRMLAHAVRSALQRQMPGAFSIDESGKFTTGTNVALAGRELVFGVTFFTPVLSSLLPFDADRQYAPAGVVGVGTDRMILPDGSGAAEAGCE